MFTKPVRDMHRLLAPHVRIEQFVQALEPRALGLQTREQFYAPIAFGVQISGTIGSAAGAIRVEVPVHANANGWLDLMKSRFARMVGMPHLRSEEMEFRTVTGRALQTVPIEELPHIGKLNLYVQGELMRLPEVPPIPIEYSTNKMNNIGSWISERIEQQLPEVIAAPLRTCTNGAAIETALLPGGTVQRAIEQCVVGKDTAGWTEFVRTHHMHSPDALEAAEALKTAQSISRDTLIHLRALIEAAAPQIKDALNAQEAKRMATEMQRKAAGTEDAHLYAPLLGSGGLNATLNDANAGLGSMTSLPQLMTSLAEETCAAPALHKAIANAIHMRPLPIATHTACRWGDLGEKGKKGTTSSGGGSRSSGKPGLTYGSGTTGTPPSGEKAKLSQQTTSELLERFKSINETTSYAYTQFTKSMESIRTTNDGILSKEDYLMHAREYLVSARILAPHNARVLIQQNITLNNDPIQRQHAVELLYRYFGYSLQGEAKEVEQVVAQISSLWAKMKNNTVKQEMYTTTPVKYERYIAPMRTLLKNTSIVLLSPLEAIEGGLSLDAKWKESLQKTATEAFSALIKELQAIIETYRSWAKQYTSFSNPLEGLKTALRRITAIVQKLNDADAFHYAIQYFFAARSMKDLKKPADLANLLSDRVVQICIDMHVGAPPQSAHYDELETYRNLVLKADGQQKNDADKTWVSITSQLFPSKTKDEVDAIMSTYPHVNEKRNASHEAVSSMRELKFTSVDDIINKYGFSKSVRRASAVYIQKRLSKPRHVKMLIAAYNVLYPAINMADDKKVVVMYQQLHVTASENFKRDNPEPETPEAETPEAETPEAELEVNDDDEDKEMAANLMSRMYDNFPIEEGKPSKDNLLNFLRDVGDDDEINAYFRVKTGESFSGDVNGILTKVVELVYEEHKGKENAQSPTTSSEDITWESTTAALKTQMHNLLKSGIELTEDTLNAFLKAAKKANNDNTPNLWSVNLKKNTYNVETMNTLATLMGIDMTNIKKATELLVQVKKYMSDMKINSRIIEAHHPFNAQIHNTLQPLAGAYPAYYNVMHTKQDMSKDAPYAGNVLDTYRKYHAFAGVPQVPDVATPLAATPEVTTAVATAVSIPKRPATKMISQLAERPATKPIAQSVSATPVGASIPKRPATKPIAGNYGATAPVGCGTCGKSKPSTYDVEQDDAMIGCGTHSDSDEDEPVQASLVECNTGGGMGRGKSGRNIKTKKAPAKMVKAKLVAAPVVRANAGSGKKTLPTYEDIFG